MVDLIKKKKKQVKKQYIKEKLRLSFFSVIDAVIFICLVKYYWII